jgi:hypothetical protein
MGREFIKCFTPNCTFFEPASADEIARLEEALQVRLPDELRSLLAETNGVMIASDVLKSNAENDAPTLSLVWSTAEILEENLRFRAVGEQESPQNRLAPLTALLFFASEPNGDALAFRVVNREVLDTRVVSMSHDNYHRRWEIAVSLRDYLGKFLEVIGEHENRTI